MKHIKLLLVIIINIMFLLVSCKNKSSDLKQTSINNSIENNRIMLSNIEENFDCKTIHNKFYDLDSYWEINQEWWQLNLGQEVSKDDKKTKSTQEKERLDKEKLVKRDPENLWKKQLQIILDYSNIWFISKYEDSVYHQYAVTDLDQNGRLEVITSYVLGLGRYAESYYYEVNEALNGLIVCEQKDRRSESEADIMIDNVPIYYDSEHNIYYYIFDEARRDGTKCSYENRHALSFKDGVLSDYILAYKTVLHKDSSTVIICSNADRNTISENEYDTIADTIFPDFVKMEASFSWFEPYSSDLDSNNIEKDRLMDMLLKSYKGFLIQ